ncbi:OprD family outer membrane porin [Endozoicomonas lisbonensis]|uniref:Imipenem/basic amino acid-specific outer membrane pore n=1 Tax=Endozoicomonas lisbonensis TaxID=3120522 RepID=A0ABV2SLL1_9GAMM
MKLTQLSVLSAAVMLASAAQANSFVDDSSLNIELRNHFHERSNEQKNSYDDSSSQWAQAIRADYSSGYFENIVGIDINAYYALKLGASNVDGNTNPGVLPVDTKGDSNSFGKTGYAIKFNLMDSGVAKYGRMQLDTPLINDSDSRALPSMTEAFYADYNYQGLSVFGVWATKANAKTRAGYDKYQTIDDKLKINDEAVMSFGGSYDFGNGLDLHSAYAQQNDFAKKYLTEVNYVAEVSGVGLSVGAQYGQMTADGLINDLLKAAEVDKKMSAWGIKVGADIGQASLGLAYTKVKKNNISLIVDGEELLSDSYAHGWMGGSDDTGYFGYNAVQYSDFNKNGQKAIGLSAGYDFVGLVDGLSASAAYVTSDFKTTDGKTLDEKEYNLSLKYAFPQVEGLTAQLRYAKNTEEKNNAKDVVIKDTRFIVKYNIAVF